MENSFPLRSGALHYTFLWTLLEHKFYRVLQALTYILHIRELFSLDCLLEHTSSLKFWTLNSHSYCFIAWFMCPMLKQVSEIWFMRIYTEIVVPACDWESADNFTSGFPPQLPGPSPAAQRQRCQDWIQRSWFGTNKALKLFVISEFMCFPVLITFDRFVVWVFFCKSVLILKKWKLNKSSSLQMPIWDRFYTPFPSPFERSENYGWNRKPAALQNTQALIRNLRFPY